MPEYTYKCESCNYEFDITQSIKANKKRKCPACGRSSLDRVLYPAFGRVTRTADQMSNVKDLALYNTDKLSNWEKQAKDAKYAEGSRLGKHQLEKQKMEKPWYHNPNEPKDLTRKLGNATEKQKMDYVMKGTIP